MPGANSPVHSEALGDDQKSKLSASLASAQTLLAGGVCTPTISERRNLAVRGSEPPAERRADQQSPDTHGAACRNVHAKQLVK